jgi:hypothetical protein
MEDGILDSSKDAGETEVQRRRRMHTQAESYTTTIVYVLQSQGDTRNESNRYRYSVDLSGFAGKEVPTYEAKNNLVQVCLLHGGW